MKKELSKILSDKHFTKDNVVTDREGMKNEEYSSLGAVVKTLCWSVQNRVGNQLEYIDEITLGKSIMNRSPYEINFSS